MENLKSIQKKKKETQLQGNEISRAVYNCSPMARRLIAYCISNSYEDGTTIALFANGVEGGDLEKMLVRKCEFSFSEFSERLGIQKGTRQKQLIENAVMELMGATIKIVGQKYTCYYNWFSSAGIDHETKKIEMLFNPFIFRAITKWLVSGSGYTALNLRTMGRLQSFYSMRFYELAQSERGNAGRNGNKKGEWFFELSIDEIKTIFDLPEKTYKGRINNFIKYVIKNPIEELNAENEEFEIELVKILERRKCVGFRFVCRERAKNLKKITKFDDAETKKTKTESNKINSEIAFYKKKYPAIWKRFEDFEKAQRPLFGEAFEFQIQKDIRILELVKAAADSDSSLW